MTSETVLLVNFLALVVVGVHCFGSQEVIIRGVGLSFCDIDDGSVMQFRPCRQRL